MAEENGAVSTQQPNAKGVDNGGLSRTLKLGLLLLNVALMVAGMGGPLLLRIYFLHGGKRMWLSSLVQIGGWPLMLPPLAVSYISRRRANGRLQETSTPLFQLGPALTAACGVVGVIIAVDCYLFTFSSAYLPVSTSALLSSTQMAFVAVFALLIVRQRFTPFSINSVVLLTLGAVVLGSHSAGDRPAGDSRYQYYLGFVMTIAAAAVYGLTLPLTELMFMKARQKVTYSLVMEMQMVVSVFASVFCVVGMLASKDFQAIPTEAREYGLGEAKYYVVLALGAVLWQIYNLGLMGVISCSSSLFAGIIGAALLPVAQVVAVLFFHERFDSGKGVSLALSLWGFASYWYGEVKQQQQGTKAEEGTAAAGLELPLTAS